MGERGSLDRNDERDKYLRAASYERTRKARDRGIFWAELNVVEHHLDCRVKRARKLTSERTEKAKRMLHGARANAR